MGIHELRRAAAVTLPALAGLAAAVTACGPERSTEDGGALHVAPLESPARSGAGQPFLTVDGAGRALLTWLETAGDSTALRLSTLDEAGWSEPRTVAAGRDFVVNWADFPAAVAAGDDRLAVHWLEREGSDAYAYGIRLSFSDDGGRTWSEPLRPHRDTTETEHGFVSMLPAVDGSVDAFWLDGRNFAAALPEMTLRTARVGPASLEEEALLDARICDCCQTDAALTSRGPVVVYRDRSGEEIRDIAIVRRLDDRWTEPATVHDDGWLIHGCPVNGPAVAAREERVAVAWFTAARDSAKVMLAFSDDAGATFAPPLRVDDGDPAGRVDVVLLDDGSALVSWIERSGEEAALRLRRIAPRQDRRPGSDGEGVRNGNEGVTVAAVSAARPSGFPRMASTADGVVIAWTDVAAGTVRTARVSSGSVRSARAAVGDDSP